MYRQIPVRPKHGSMGSWEWRIRPAGVADVEQGGCCVLPGDLRVKFRARKSTDFPV